MQGLTQEEERALLLDAQKGKREAMESIVAQYWPLVLAAGHQRYVRSIAEDAAAAAAEELVRSVQAFDLSRGVPFAAFAKVRVYGAVSHLFRKMCRTWEHECAPADMEVMERIAGTATLDASDARLTVTPFLEKLDATERRVLALLYKEGRTTYEAAEALGVSQSKIARVKKRALAKLRAAMEGSGWERSSKCET